MSEKKHDPSSTRLRRAREKGDIASSQEVPRSVGFIAAIIVLGGVAPQVVAKIGEGIRDLLSEPLRPQSEVVGQAITRMMDFSFWGIVMAPLLAYAVAAMVGTFAQTQGLISFAKLELKFENVNPMSGFQRIFSLRSIVNFIRMILKTALCVGGLVAVLWSMAEPISQLGFSSVATITPVFSKTVMGLFTVAAIIYVSSGVFDVFYERFEYLKRQRMTDEEVKQENKDQYGDPHVRGERKSIQREDAQSGGLKKTVEYTGLAISGPGPILLLIGFGRTPTGISFMLLRKMRGGGVDAVRAELLKQNKPIVADARLASMINESVAEKAMFSEALSAEVFPVWRQFQG